MNMFEEARAIDGKIKMCGFTQSDIAKKLGVSQSYIANKLRLLAYSDDLQSQICTAGLTERHARAVLRIRSDEGRREAIKKIIDGKLTVKESESLVDMMYDAEIPTLLSRVDAIDRISAFEEALVGAVRSLNSFGIDASLTKNRYGERIYITVCVEE